VTVVSCLAPTEVMLVLTTDIPCGALGETSIAVSDPSGVTSASPVTVTRNCTLVGPDADAADGGTLAVPADIGSLVLVPSGSRSGTFAVQIVAAVAPVVDPNNCMAPAYHGCIVARRQLSFIPHTSLTLPIEITLDCLNVECSSADETCDHGACVSSQPSCAESNDCVIPPDASPIDDAEATEAGYDATVGTPDAADATPIDAPMSIVSDEASTMDAAPAAAPDAAPDAPNEPQEDAGPEASIHDAAPEVGPTESGVPEASSPPPEAGVESDAGPLGVCLLDAGQSSGVQCGETRCTSAAPVCCVTFNSSVGPEGQTCETLAECGYNTSPTDGTIYSALECLTAGDCAPGKVCCLSASMSGAGTIAQCVTTCTFTYTSQATACQNSCECGGGAESTCNPQQCDGYSIGTCGAAGNVHCL
jgi:hypothetical protein